MKKENNVKKDVDKQQKTLLKMLCNKGQLNENSNKREGINHTCELR